jgi:hypothetical protein
MVQVKQKKFYGLIFWFSSRNICYSNNRRCLYQTNIRICGRRKIAIRSNPQASFIYENSEKCYGEIQYKVVVNPDITTLWILPSSLVLLKNSLDYLAALPYIFTWMAVATLLRKYYKSLRLGRFSLILDYFSCSFSIISNWKWVNNFLASRYTISILF